MDKISSLTRLTGVTSRYPSLTPVSGSLYCENSTEKGCNTLLAACLLTMYWPEMICICFRLAFTSSWPSQELYSKLKDVWIKTKTRQVLSVKKKEKRREVDRRWFPLVWGNMCSKECLFDTQKAKFTNSVTVPLQWGFSLWMRLKSLHIPWIITEKYKILLWACCGFANSTTSDCFNRTNTVMELGTLKPAFLWRVTAVLGASGWLERVGCSRDRDLGGTIDVAGRSGGGAGTGSAHTKKWWMLSMNGTHTLMRRNSTFASAAEQ